MKKSDLAYLLDVLPKGRIPFYYFKDRYAIQLLERVVANEPLAVNVIKKSPFGKLLDRPVVKNGLKSWGDGWVSKDRLALLFDPQAEMFRISFDGWGTTNSSEWRYEQTSRKGYNLVVQLNFNNIHNKDFKALIDQAQYKRSDQPFKAGGHPTRADSELTIAWARVDIAEDYSYALIEEVQTDWLRYANYEVYSYYIWELDDRRKLKAQKKTASINGFPLKAYRAYYNRYMKPLSKIWAEVMLAATLHTLWTEIGVETIFYHTHETGGKLKDCTPPRSIYTQLPKKFCFQQTEDYPAFLSGRIKFLKKKMPVRFFKLEM